MTFETICIGSVKSFGPRKRFYVDSNLTAISNLIAEAAL